MNAERLGLINAERIYQEQDKTFYVGQRVFCNGFPGTISKVCTGQLDGMVEVRMAHGFVCVSAGFPDCYAA